MNIVNVGYHSTNYYVLANHRPRLLLDAGWPGSLGKLRESCRRMGIRTDISLEGNIVLTEASSRAFLKNIGINGEMIATPGYSNDNVTLILEEDAAFTGDLTNPALLPDDPTNAVWQSWQKIREKGATTIYPAHGPVWKIENV